MFHRRFLIATQPVKLNRKHPTGVKHPIFKILQPHLKDAEIAWLVCRGLFKDNPTVPSWNGWLSKVACDTPVTVSTVGYMKPVFNPATDFATVQKCLLTSMEVMSKVQQEYTMF